MPASASITTPCGLCRRLHRATLLLPPRPAHGMRTGRRAKVEFGSGTPIVMADGNGPRRMPSVSCRRTAARTKAKRRSSNPRTTSSRRCSVQSDRARTKTALIIQPFFLSHASWNAGLRSRTNSAEHRESRRP